GGLAVDLGEVDAHGGFHVVPEGLVADLRRQLRGNVVLAVEGETVGGIHAAPSWRCSGLANGVSNNRSSAASWLSPPSRRLKWRRQALLPGWVSRYQPACLRAMRGPITGP